MLRFNAADFAFLCFHVEQFQGDACGFDAEATGGAAAEKEWRELVLSGMQAVKHHAAKLGLDAVAGQAERIEKQALGSIEILPLCYLLRDLEGTIVRELKKPVFLMLRTDLSEFYDPEDKPIWGDAVQRQFSKATHDINEARRCLALERWDGCVHHLMRAVEHAIRKWAKDLRLRTKLPLDLENLEQILQAADTKHKEIKNRSKSRKRDTDLKYLAETSGHFGFIKDAWRNPGAHARETYDERKAKNLMVHVEAFARLLASRQAPIT